MTWYEAWFDTRTRTVLTCKTTRPESMSAWTYPTPDSPFLLIAAQAQPFDRKELDKWVKAYTQSHP